MTEKEMHKPSDFRKYILHWFHYQDGRITRLDRGGGEGSYDKDGYLILKVKGKQFKAHRIVWLLCTGQWPTHEIDHINGNRTDNRFSNLREADRTVQNINSRHAPNKDTGYVGVHFDNTKGLKAHYSFSMQDKTYRFRSLEEAVSSRKSLREKTLNKHLQKLKTDSKAISSMAVSEPLKEPKNDR